MCLGMKEPEKTTWKMLKLAGGSCWGTCTKEHWEERWGSHFPAQQKSFFFCCTGSLRPHSPSTYLHTLGTHPASAWGQPGTWQHPICTPHMPASPTACQQGWGWPCPLPNTPSTPSLLTLSLLLAGGLQAGQPPSCPCPGGTSVPLSGTPRAPVA